LAAQSNVVMMRVYIFLAVAVVVLVIVAMRQFQDENRQHSSTLRQTNSLQNGRADHALVPEVINFDFELTMTLQKYA
jgi:hypothetical protein